MGGPVTTGERGNVMFEVDTSDVTNEIPIIRKRNTRKHPQKIMAQ